MFSNENLDMGVLVVHGISGSSDFTLVNKSPIEMPLIIDMRPKKVKFDQPEHIEHVKLTLLDNDDQL